MIHRYFPCLRWISSIFSLSIVNYNLFYTISCKKVKNFRRFAPFETFFAQFCVTNRKIFWRFAPFQNCDEDLYRCRKEKTGKKLACFGFRRRKKIENFGSLRQLKYLMKIFNGTGVKKQGRNWHILVPGGEKNWNFWPKYLPLIPFIFIARQTSILPNIKTPFV